jgi:hypothetical protein
VKSLDIWVVHDSALLRQAHDQAVRSMIWSHNENWMVTGDDGGCIKFVTPSSCMIHTLLWLLLEIICLHA